MQSLVYQEVHITIRLSFCKPLLQFPAFDGKSQLSALQDSCAALSALPCPANVVFDLIRSLEAMVYICVQQTPLRNSDWVDCLVCDSHCH